MNHTPYLTMNQPQSRSREHAPRELFSGRPQFPYENRAGSPTVHNRSNSINAFNNFNPASSQYFSSQTYVQKQMPILQPPPPINNVMNDIMQKLQQHDRLIKNLSEQLKQNTRASRKNLQEHHTSLSNLHEHNSFVIPYDNSMKYSDQIQAVRKELDDVKKTFLQFDKIQKESVRDSNKNISKDINHKINEEIQNYTRGQEDSMLKKLKSHEDKWMENQQMFNSELRKLKNNQAGQLEAIKQMINQTKNKIQEVVDKKNNQVLRLQDLSVSTEKSQKRALKIYYQEYIGLSRLTGNEQNKAIKLNQRTYFIDSDRYLLDNNYCYIIDKTKSRIQLSQKHVKLLKQNGILV